MAYFICANRIKKVPHSTTMALDSLSGENIILKSIRDNVVLLYNFRNKITHNYQDITIKELYDGITTACSTYKEFMDAALKFV